MYGCIIECGNEFLKFQKQDEEDELKLHAVQSIHLINQLMQILMLFDAMRGIDFNYWEFILDHVQL